METVARIDRKRRAEIGRERRARTRAQLVEAARFLFTSRPIASVTVEDVTKQARLAKGTFYSHFRQLDELWAAVAAEIVEAFAEIADTSRHSITDPLEVIAMGCAAFIGEAQRDPAWGALIARGAGAFAPVAGAARERLKTNLRLAQRQGRLTCSSIDVGFDLVFGIVVQAMRSASEARLSRRDIPEIVKGILRVLGVKPEDAESVLRRVEHGLEKWRRTLRKGQASSMDIEGDRRCC
jgi:AcrR family transcriptional regulator